MKVTNYIVQSTNCDYIERYILPEFRGRMNELLAIADKHGFEPLLVIGKDGKWWNDELEFIFDRMSDGYCCRGDVLDAWAKEIESHPLAEGETRKIIYDGETYSVTADCEDLSDDGVITNDCEPVDMDVFDDEEEI